MTEQHITDDECMCNQPDSVRLKRLLFHGVVVQCNSCGKEVNRIEDATVLDQLVAKLSRPESELEVTIPQHAWDHGE